MKPKRRRNALPKKRHKFPSGHVWSADTKYRSDLETGRSVPTTVDVTVHLEGGTPAIRVTLENWRTRAAKWLRVVREIEVGDGAFDERFLLEATARVPARDLLMNEDLREAIQDLFSAGVRALVFGHDGLVASMRAREFVGSRRESILRHLERAAGVLERPPLSVSVLDGERRAATGESGKPHCPYCRDSITGDEPDLVACRQCATVLHDECWQELGRCPILGCLGRHPERPRAPRKRPKQP